MPRHTMNDALMALFRSSSADPQTVERVTERLAPKEPPEPFDGRSFTAALRRLGTGAPTVEEAARLRREASPTFHLTESEIERSDR